MDMFGQMAAAAARYQNAREPSEPERLAAVKVRDEHLTEQVPAEMLEAATAPTQDGSSQREYLERRIELAGAAVFVGALRKGLEATRSVARVEAKTTNQLFFGTGFLVSPELLLTAGHVLPDVDTARGSVALFDYEILPDGSTVSAGSRFGLNPDRLFVTSEALDYTLIAVESGQPGYTYGWCSLDSHIGKIVAGEKVQVVGHPEGQPKSVLFDNEVKYVLDDFLQYLAPNLAGASGGPVFNRQWELVAMHHAMVPPFEFAESGWHLREATLISAIVRSLDAADINGTDGELLTDMLSGGGV
jgi:endonuclease G, mitochondrial